MWICTWFWNSEYFISIIWIGDCVLIKVNSGLKGHQNGSKRAKNRSKRTTNSVFGPINQPLSCILAIVLFSFSMESVKVSPSCPELICVSHCCCFCLRRLALLSWPSTQTDSVVALCLFLMLFVCFLSLSVPPTCPELVCEWDPMLWLLSSRRTLSNVGILPFDLHTFDVYVDPLHLVLFMNIGKWRCS